MPDVVSVFAEFAEMIGLPSLALQRSGTAEIVLDGRISVYFIPVGETILELSTKLVPGPVNWPPQRLAKLLFAHLTQPRCGAGRFCIDPGDRSIRFGERLDTRKLDGDGLRQAVERFVTRVEFLKSEAAADILDERTETQRRDDSLDLSYVIRG